MSDLDKLFDAALKKPHASAITEGGAVVSIEPATEVTEVTEVSQVTEVTATTQQAVATTPPANMPWDKADSRVKLYFQVRMPEPLKRKIEWLELQRLLRGERRSRGMQHDIVLGILEREIDRLIAKELKAK